ncbi:MAG: phosphonate ABC transporter [Burkholderiales bacterium PBB3]|nr:MAG: phosphonate ABC transporter [Burkholderiales bacterium PBB3]
MKLELKDCTARHLAASASAPAALKGLSLVVPSGSQLAVIGPSGAGKTTLLQVMACALRPTTGQLLLDGAKPWALPTAALQTLRGHLFLAPQVPPLPPRQRVVTSVLAGRLPNMGLWASLRSLLVPFDTGLAEQALARFDLAEKLFDRVDRLSGGERQRVGLARLVASTARLLLVDEPLSALDPERARQALATLTDEARTRGVTLVASLHHVDMALQFFPRIVGLRDGAVFFDLPAFEVTPALLSELYASHLEELTGPAPALDLTLAATPAVLSQCR